MFNFIELQGEVKRRAVRDQGDQQFDTATKNIINTSLFRLAREANWRVLRRKDTITTNATYTTGSGNGSFTNDSSTINVSAANWLTNSIEIDRRIKLSGDATYHTIKTITAEDNLTIEKDYSGDATTSGTYSILGQEEYNLPPQTSHRMFMWHEAYGYPYQMSFVTDQEYYRNVWNNTNEAVPLIYRMWGENMVISKLKEASVITAVSSSTDDTGIDITIFGEVEGYPDFEVITTDGADGTTSVAGSKSFTSVERVVKSKSSLGRMTITANSGNTTVAVIPVGEATLGILYKKIQIWPLPNTQFEINLQSYKDPYKLVNDGDIHEMGSQFDEALILLAVSKIKAENDQEESQRFAAFYTDEIRSLKKHNVDKIDWFPTLQRPSSSSSDIVHQNLLYRQVGSFFGRGSRY